MIDIQKYIHESNLIEDIDDPAEDRQSLKAWNFLKNKTRIQDTTLLQLHNMITVNQLPKQQSGQYRFVDVMVGGRICPAPHLAHQLIHNWLYDLSMIQNRTSPIKMHIRFEKIHPFVDGNGRTGRMLMWWHEIRNGLEPTLITFADRNEYYKWFKEK